MFAILALLPTAPAPYLKKTPRAAVLAPGAYLLRWRGQTFTGLFTKGGAFTADFQGERWRGRWRVRAGRVWVREWGPGGVGPCRWSFRVPPGRPARVVETVEEPDAD